MNEVIMKTTPYYVRPSEEVIKEGGFYCSSSKKGSPTSHIEPFTSDHIYISFRGESVDEEIGEWKELIYITNGTYLWSFDLGHTWLDLWFTLGNKVSNSHLEAFMNAFNAGINPELVIK